VVGGLAVGVVAKGVGVEEEGVGVEEEGVGVLVVGGGGGGGAGAPGGRKAGVLYTGAPGLAKMYG